MKKLYAIFALTLLVFSLMGTAVMAAGNAPSSLPNQKAVIVANDNGKASTSVFWDKIKLAITSNKEKRAEISLDIANKRAAKASQLLEDDNNKEADKYVEKHDEAINEAEQNLDQIASNGDNQSVLDALRATVIMQYRLELHKQKVSSVHSGILERQAGRMNKTRLSHLDTVFARIDNRSAQAEQRIDQKQQNLIARYKILTGASDEEVQSILDGFRADIQAN